MLRMLAAILVATACLATGAPLSAQSWPQRPVRIIVITPPAGFPDFAARALADHMGPLLGQPIVVENRPGGGGNIATAAVASAEPDGHTILLTGNNHAVNATLIPNPGFDYVRSFAPVGLVAMSNMLLVASPDLKATSVKEVLEAARTKSGGLSFAVPQVGTPGHLGAELFAQETKANLVFVPYAGVGPALPDLASGRVDLILSAFPAVASMVQAGRVKPLAVTRAQRSPLMPDVPTVAESGVPGFDVAGWVALMAPAGTPPAVVQRLNTVMREALAKPEMREAFAKQALDITPSTPAELAAFMEAESKKWAGVLANAKVK